MNFTLKMSWKLTVVAFSKLFCSVWELPDASFRVRATEEFSVGLAES